jgi:hypothetical protein
MFTTSSKSDRLVPVAGSNTLGMVLAAGVLLTVLGGFHILAGLLAVGGDDDAVVSKNYAFELTVPTWGWIHLVFGVVALGLGIAILMGRSWAYVFALCLAFLSALANFAFLPEAPLWSAMLIAFDVLVMRALVIELNEPS